MTNTPTDLAGHAALWSTVLCTVAIDARTGGAALLILPPLVSGALIGLYTYRTPAITRRWKRRTSFRLTVFAIAAALFAAGCLTIAIDEAGMSARTLVRFMTIRAILLSCFGTVAGGSLALYLPARRRPASDGAGTQ